MTPNGPLKMAVRAAIKAGGGIKVAAHVCCVSETQAGRWNCLTDHDLPKREHLAALDELAIAHGARAFILEEMARGLGHVAFLLPEAHGAAAEVTVQLAVAAAEFGEIAQSVVAALADGRFDAAENARTAAEIDDAIRALAALRSLVVDDECRIPGVRVAA